MRVYFLEIIKLTVTAVRYADSGKASSQTVLAVLCINSHLSPITHVSKHLQSTFILLNHYMPTLP